MAILVVTNRNIANRNRTDTGLFGDQVNDRGPSEIRLAWAERRGRRWELDLIPEPQTLTADNRPSRLIFHACRDSLTDTGRDCVLYVHGFNQDFADTLNQAQAIRARYEVALVLFSWPSNPGGFFLGREYAKARAIARISSVAFARTLDLLTQYLREHNARDCQTSFNMLVHSLGNLLLEDFVRDSIFAGHARGFDNIVLHQADVDLNGHEHWVDRLRVGRRLYVTINERDKILDISDIINPDRLGNTARDLAAARAVYVDFTDTPDVHTTHLLFEHAAKANSKVERFFNTILRGDNPERTPALIYDPQDNAYRLVN